MGIQKINAEGADELVVMTRSEYDALLEALEDAEDLAASYKAHLDLAMGKDEAVPFEMVKRMLDGESPLLVWREHRGLSVDEAAGRAGLAAERWAAIEGGAAPSEAEAAAAATALGVEPDDLV